MQIAMVAMVVASGVMQASQQQRAGQIAEAQSKIDANAEGDAAVARELERKRKLQIALSSQIAKAGAEGVMFSEGSPARIAQLDIAEAASDSRMDTANSRQRRRALRLQGKNAAAAATGQAAVTLLDTAAKSYNMYG